MLASPEIPCFQDRESASGLTLRQRRSREIRDRRCTNYTRIAVSSLVALDVIATPIFAALAATKCRDMRSRSSAPARGGLSAQ